VNNGGGDGGGSAEATTRSPAPATRIDTPPFDTPSFDAAREDRRRWLVLAVVGTANVMSTLDTFIVNVAIPSIRHDLHASSGEAELVVTIYSLVYAVLLITGGRLGDLFGRSRLFVIGIATFTVASAACGLAPTAGFLIGARALQAAGAAIMVPQAYAVIQQVFRPTERVRALSLVTTAASVAVIFAQLVGGVLVQLNLFGLEWRSVFFVNVPVGVVAMVAGLVVLPRVDAERQAKLDLPGVVLVTTALLMVVVPLTEGRDLGWPPWLVVTLAGSPVAMWLFVRYQLWRTAHHKMPLVELSLFKARSFSVGVVLVALGQISNAGLFFVLAIYLQSGRGLSPVMAGLVFAPLGIGYMSIALMSPRLSRRYGRTIIGVGYLVVAVAILGAILILRLAPDASPFLLVAPVTLMGAGQGFVNAPLFATVLSRVRAGHEGAASGVMTTVQQTFASIGVAIEGLAYYSALGATAVVAGRIAPSAASNAFDRALWLNLVFILTAAAVVRLLPAKSATGARPAGDAGGTGGPVVEAPSVG